MYRTVRKLDLKRQIDALNQRQLELPADSYKDGGNPTSAGDIAGVPQQVTSLAYEKFRQLVPLKPDR